MMTMRVFLSPWILVVFLCGLYLPVVFGEIKDIRVAAIFEEEYAGMLMAFQNAMTKANMRQMTGSSRTLIFQPERVEPNDSFDANRKVCRQMKEGIAAVFGPLSEVPRAHVQSLCNAYDIPHIQATWDSREDRDVYSISLYPDHIVLSKAYADLIKYWEWKRFTVVYEDNESLVRLQEILKTARGDEYTITVRKLGRLRSSYTTMLKDIKAKQEYHIIIDCHPLKIKQLLNEAIDLGMLSEYFHFHFTTLDLPILDLKGYISYGANITSMALIDNQAPLVRDLISEWKYMEMSNSVSPMAGHKSIPTEIALIYDAVHLLARALKQVDFIDPKPMSCAKRETWSHGSTLLNYMSQMDFEGLSGRIKFNGIMKREEFKLNVLKLGLHGLKKIGSWNNGTVQITETAGEKAKDDLERLRNATLRVVTVYDAPYVSLLSEPNENGSMHEGFVVDILDMLKDRLGFRYTIHEVPDRQYGSELKDGKWSGMVGEIMDRDKKSKADLAAAGMTITYERSRVVDFTKPFLNLGITILYKKPIKKPPELFSFSHPLSVDVWIYMIAAYLCVSFMLFVIARFTPYEWENPHPCNEESEEVENQFTILNSLWFTIGSLMQQGCEIAPKAISTRMVACLWWFFTMIIISSYTANLAAFLTVSRMDAPIKNADDLSKQKAIPYGTLSSGSTHNFFKNSNITTFKRMWSYMSANSDKVFVQSNSDGYNRVKNSDFAFLGESAGIDYQVQRNCDLMQVGDLLDSKGYGLATPKDSPWLPYISREIVYLQEKQFIQKAYIKWWKEKSNAQCGEEIVKVDNNALGLENVGGVFIVLMGGSFIGLIISIMEFLWKVKKNSAKDKQSFMSELSEEFRFMLKCKSTKSTRREPSNDVIDNEIKFAPLTILKGDKIPKEVYD